MKVRDAMNENIRYIPADTNLKTAAQEMARMDCGFLPIRDREKDQLMGVITDRDMAVRAIADSCDPMTTTVDEVMTKRVLYCYADDDLQTAAGSMHKQQVYRLIVLNNAQEKQLCGVISLGDIVHQDEVNLAVEAAKGIHKKAA